MTQHRLSRAQGFAALALLACLSASAQDTPRAPSSLPDPQARAAVFPVTGFEVSGSPLDKARTDAILAPFVRPDATLATLREAAAALENALRARGEGLLRVTVPPQAAQGVVRLEVLRFSLGTVTVQGQVHNDEPNVRASLPTLREGQTPNLQTLAVQTAMANENPNRQLQVLLRPSSQADRIDATVQVSDKRPWTFGLSAANFGTDATGRDRLTVFGGHSNVFQRDHQFVGAYTTSVENTSGVQQVGLSYRVPLYSALSMLGAVYTRSDVVGDFGAFTSTGAGHTLGLNLTRYLPPQGGRRSYVSLGLDDRVFRAPQVNDIVVPGQLDRRSRPITLGWAARTEAERSVTRQALELAANTGAGEGNTLEAYRSEDLRISRVHWKALRGSAGWLTSMAGDWQLSLRGQFQYSDDALIAGEQLGLGGLTSVRGTRQERPVAGDKGVVGTAELTTPALAPGLRLLVFADGGRLGNTGPHSALRPSSDIITSAGLGARFSRAPVSLSVDYGRLLHGSRVPQALNTFAPQKGDDRLYVNLVVRF